MGEKRRCRRIQRSVVRVETIGGHRMQGEVHDFSLDGICLSAPLRAVRGDHLELTLVETHSQRLRLLRARVRWQRDSRFGLAWIGLSTRDQEWMRALINFRPVERSTPWG